MYNEKMKYCFEKYEYNNRGRIFLGYESVVATSNEEAREIVQQKVGEDIVLAQIYITQNS